MRISLVIFSSILLLSGCYRKGKPIKFEKIIFHTSMCFGDCPIYHLEVDSNKKLMLYAEWVAEPNGRPMSNKGDTSKMGYFYGSVSDTSFNKLLVALQTVDINSLKFDGATCCDGSEITIIVYYNGRRKYLKSMFPPEKTNQLIHVLYEIAGQSNLDRTIEKFHIEDTLQSQYSPGS